MAYRRSIIARSKLFYQQHQRFTPSLSHITSSSSDREELPAPKTISPNSEHLSPFLRYNAGNSLLSGNVSRLFRSNTPIFHRNFSNVVEDKAMEAAPVVNDVALAVADPLTPVVNEVSVAAADSFAPVAAFQHLIGYVHSYTGLEWWASIATTTLIMRFILLPIHIDCLQHMPAFKSDIPKIVNNFKELKAIMNKQRASDPKRADELMSNQWKLFRASVPVHRYTLIDVCAKISLFFAVYNMVEKIPSFRTGGMLWFTDLTTPDRLYLPILMALTFWIRMMLANPASSTRTQLFYSAVISAVTVAFGFPPAIYCNLITSNFYFMAFSIARNPRLSKLLMSLGRRSTGK